MGVTCVCQWPVPENKSFRQSVDMVTKRIELLGATKTGNFTVDCETYQSTGMQGPPKILHVMHHTEFPLTSFAVSDQGNCLVAESSFDQLMQKLKGAYIPRKAARIDCKGLRYQLADFVVKVGIVSIGPSTKGILIEVEYGPCLVLQDSWGLLTEFMQGFMGNHIPPMSPYLTSKQDAIFTPTDVMKQYLEHFNNYRKSQVSR